MHTFGCYIHFLPFPAIQYIHLQHHYISLHCAVHRSDILEIFNLRIHSNHSPLGSCLKFTLNTSFCSINKSTCFTEPEVLMNSLSILRTAFVSEGFGFHLQSIVVFFLLKNYDNIHQCAKVLSPTSPLISSYFARKIGQKVQWCIASCANMHVKTLSNTKRVCSRSRWSHTSSIIFHHVCFSQGMQVSWREIQASFQATYEKLRGDPDVVHSTVYTGNVTCIPSSESPFF